MKTTKILLIVLQQPGPQNELGIHRKLYEHGYSVRLTLKDKFLLARCDNPRLARKIAQQFGGGSVFSKTEGTRLQRLIANDESLGHIVGIWRTSLQPPKPMTREEASQLQEALHSNSKLSS